MAYNLGLSQSANLAYNLAGQSAIDGGGFSPLLLSPTLYLDGAQPLWPSSNPVNGAALSTWNDESGNGNNATNSTAAGTKPSFTANAILGGGVVSFDGGDHLISDILVSVTAGEHTLFVVAKRNSGSAAERMYSVGPTAPLALRSNLRFENTADSVVFGSNATGSGFVTATSVTTANYNLFTCRRMGTEQYLQVNNGTPFTNSGGTAITDATAGRIGSNVAADGAFLNGSIAEFIAYSRALTAAEIAQVNAYLINKRGLV